MGQKTDEAEIVDTGSLTRRWIMYVVGIYVLTFGVSLAIRAGIGVSPLSSLTRTMTLVYPPLSQGTYNFITELIMLALTYLVLPKDFRLKSFASLLPAFALAVFLDFNLSMTEFVKLDVYYAKVALLVFADAALAYGLFLMIRANLVLMPMDMFVNTLCKRTGWKWGNIKTGYDCALLVVSAGIGLAFLADIPFIREGTVLNAVLVGQYIRLYFFLYKKMQARKTAPSSSGLEPAAK
ncbi:hypothetical protein HT585_16805 [Ensifer sp. HO-A22]|uniref:Membrane protein YczE n=1 Tax=Ensifer oleiphilus TaxID=2742698 RepID=A0A7Y6UNQ8_9HYPH|nr:DUF6198 family protein [Ensifer oleiphilus]NVD40530.1 hypothetical protein [Ensifer oleiphilus]